ncbi:hypothetical protein GCM10010156_36660 [Planobispora rosea]|uniref:Uncharacterized protein n=1 Tax=Planobispora rosea TaxID=35762 RepID=A0A8J3WA58_PLARO|nr:hypothetical protein [Planobispora rosea]GGS74381.1 hypothetical protein GCM10010156_36660 [Planobispora rosea]GIH81740.1 hypothetical protein Pro02_01480 [Planobispora rosea]
MLTVVPVRREIPYGARLQTVVPVRSGIPYGARLALLFVLALSTVVVHLNQAPPLRDAEELIADLRAGGVTKVVYDRSWPAYGTLTWSHGPLSWSQARFDQPGDVWDPETTRLIPQALERRQEAFLARVRAAADPSVEIVRIGGSARGPMGLTAGSPAYGRWWAPFAPLAMAAEVLAWLLMLTRRDHRYASRPAWCWMFLVGGSFLYVLLEPYPLWRGRYEPLPCEPLPAGPGIDGTKGFVLAVTVAFGLGIAAS